MGKAENMKMIYMVYSFLWNIYSILAPNVDLFMNAGTNNNYYIYYSWFLSRSFLAHDLTLVTSIPDNKNGHLILMMIQSKHRTMLFYSNLDLVYCIANIQYCKLFYYLASCRCMIFSTINIYQAR